jgi:putative ABC transport system substrate-binding protein
LNTYFEIDYTAIYMAFKTRRKFLQELAFITSSAPFIASFKSPCGVPRIGFLMSTGLTFLDTAFTEELEKLGFKDGETVVMEKRFARPNTNDPIVFAQELAKMNLSLTVVSSLPFAIEVRKANPEMPLVICTCPGMVSNGFAQSLERPGGIYTGMDELPSGITSRRLQLLKAAAPGITRVALLSTTPGIGGHESQLSEAEKTAPEMGIKVKPYRASSFPQLEKALADITADKMDGMLNFQGGLSLANRKLITDFAAQHTIPAIYQATLFTEAGGLMSWAPDLIQQFREAAHYVDKILKGAKPGDLPVQHPSKYYLTVNLTAAKKIGLTFAQELLLQATKIIP